MLCPSKRKRAKNPAYKKGDIIAFKSRNDYLKRDEYTLILILDTWYVKTNHYQYITLETYGSQERKLARMDISEMSESKFLQHFFPRISTYWKEIPLNDFTLLLVCGHPRQCIKDALQSKTLKKKIQSNLKKGQRTLDRWNNVKEHTAELRRKMEKEDVKITNSQSV